MDFFTEKTGTPLETGTARLRPDFGGCRNLLCPKRKLCSGGFYVGPEARFTALVPSEVV